MKPEHKASHTSHKRPAQQEASGGGGPVMNDVYTMYAISWQRSATAPDTMVAAAAAKVYCKHGSAGSAVGGARLRLVGLAWKKKKIHK